MTYLDPDLETEVDSVVGAFMLVRREAIRRVGLFDEAFFMYGEDLDWAYRIKQAGIGYSTNPQEADDLKHRLEEMAPGVEIQIVRLGPVLGVHGGPGTLGIGVLEGED